MIHVQMIQRYVFFPGQTGIHLLIQLHYLSGLNDFGKRKTEYCLKILYTVKRPHMFCYAYYGWHLMTFAVSKVSSKTGKCGFQGKKFVKRNFQFMVLMELLFQHSFECLADCEVCLPCTGDAIIEKPCFEELTTTDDSS